MCKKENIEEIKEVWRNIKGYNGEYQISNLGRVKSFKRATERIMKPLIQKNMDTYYHISLVRGTSRKSFPIHLLVAKAFVPNPRNLPIINHKDKDKTNNVYTNLEWCAKGEGIYNKRVKRNNDPNNTVRRKTRLVGQYNKNDELIAVYDSSEQASEINGIKQSGIMRCCRFYKNCKNDVSMDYKGYKWKYLHK